MAKKRYIVIGENNSRRVQLFKEALVARGESEPVVVSYLDLIAGYTRLDDLIEEDDVVRMESPGKDFEVERALLKLGCVAQDRDSYGEFVDCGSHNSLSHSILERDVDKLVFDRGLILPQRQWYRGWCFVLNLISRQSSRSQPHLLMNSAEEIAVLFDKARCHELLSQGGVNVPAALGSITSFDDLCELMRAQNCRRVFLKPAHGSSASGIVAYEYSGERHRAVSTVEMMLSEGGAIKLYNSRKVRTYTSKEEIITLVNALCQHNLFVQRWYPKAAIDKKVFDLRVVVIAGKSRHVVVRESKTTFTNLHLLNGRGQLSAVRKVLGDERYAGVLATCEAAAKLFPRCLYVGVDILVSSDFRRHAVAEVNAFGDLLPGILFDGLGTYEVELAAIAATGGAGVLYV